MASDVTSGFQWNRYAAVDAPAARAAGAPPAARLE